MMPATEALGLVAIIIMVGSYALEQRGNFYVATFAVGCAMAAIYAYLIQSYPFLLAEGLWSIIAARRWWVQRGVRKESVRSSVYE